MKVGLDIGYSNVKLAFVDGSGHARTLLFPASSALASSQSKMSMLAQGSGYTVLVDGVSYVAGADPETLSEFNRVVHEDYTGTQQYKSLFHAALLAVGVDRIEHLVTGLPVWQFEDDELTSRLCQQLEGTHQITPKVAVTVDRVTVVPQPFGAFMDCVSRLQANDPVFESTVLVVDPGFYSVDWVVIDKGQFKRDRSDSDMRASSVVIDRICLLVRDEYGQTPVRERIENALRQGKEEIVVGGSYRNIAPLIDQAKKEVSASIVDKIKEMLRDRSLSIDVVVMAGGGATLYGDAIKEAFPQSRFLQSDDPVLSNARGFLVAANR